MKITIPVFEEKELEKRFETWLNRRQYKFKKKDRYTMLEIEIDEPIDAYFIGANVVALGNRMFDTSITKTLS